jgi:hypothetical protein
MKFLIGTGIQLKRSYYNWGGVFLGLSVTVCTILSENSASFAKHFFAQPQTLAVYDPRPVGAAMTILERRFGVIITYEDAPYIHEADVEDQTSPEWRQAHPNGPRALIPKHGSLEITYQMSPGPIKSDEIQSVIQKLLDTHAEKNNPGRFRLQREGEVFHIIPVQVRNSSGSLVSVESILDTAISFPEQERTVSSTVELITNIVSRVRGIKFGLGSGPTNLMSRTPFRRGANNETARDVLLSALQATNGKLSWRIFYGPGNKWYVLNVHYIRSR